MKRLDLSTKGRAAKGEIMTALHAVSALSAPGALDGTDGSGNKYSTNTSNTTANICRELIRQIAAVAPARFSDISNNHALQSVPFASGDTINFRLTVRAAPNQQGLTGVANFDARVYKIQLNIKAADFTNVAPTDVDGVDILDYVANA